MEWEEIRFDDSYVNGVTKIFEQFVVALTHLHRLPPSPRMYLKSTQLGDECKRERGKFRIHNNEYYRRSGGGFEFELKRILYFRHDDNDDTNNGR